MKLQATPVFFLPLSLLASAGVIPPQTPDICDQYATYAQNQLQTLGPLIQYEIYNIDNSTTVIDNSNTVDNSVYADNSQDNSVYVDNSVDNSEDHSINIDVSPIFDTDTPIDTTTDIDTATNIDTDTTITPQDDLLTTLVKALGQVNRATGSEAELFRSEIVQACAQGGSEVEQTEVAGDVYGALSEVGYFYGQGSQGGSGGSSGSRDGDEHSLGSLLDGVLEAVGALLGGLL
ncbi:hypothetical protein BDV12DRAFT_201586 [Aspergillus spectabilis]